MPTPRKGDNSHNYLAQGGTDSTRLTSGARLAGPGRPGVHREGASVAQRALRSLRGPEALSTSGSWTPALQNPAHLPSDVRARLLKQLPQERTRVAELRADTHLAPPDASPHRCPGSWNKSVGTGTRISHPSELRDTSRPFPGDPRLERTQSSQRAPGRATSARLNRRRPRGTRGGHFL